MGRRIILIALLGACSFSVRVDPTEDVELPPENLPPTGCMVRYLDLCAQPPPVDPWVIDTAEVIDTDSDPRCRSLTQPGGPAICLVHATVVAIHEGGSLTAAGGGGGGSGGHVVIESASIMIAGEISANGGGGGQGGGRLYGPVSAQDIVGKPGDDGAFGTTAATGGSSGDLRWGLGGWGGAATAATSGSSGTVGGGGGGGSVGVITLIGTAAITGVVSPAPS